LLGEKFLLNLSKLFAKNCLQIFSRKSSSASWQALVDEDRLLSRIDMLEKKLLYFSKPLSEDKLREEIMKLQNEKMQYQTSAKQALKKVYNERMEALQKMSVVEKALCSTEDECSLLREQVSKSQSQSRETNERIDAMQNQMDKKITDYEEKIYKKETELKNLNSELNELQEKLTNYKVFFLVICLYLLSSLDSMSQSNLQTTSGKKIFWT
jgi:chromosome segregation ATPase